MTPDVKPASGDAVQQRTARIAGLLYLIVVVTGFFSIVHVPSQTVVPGDAAATFASLVESELLFQLGIVAGFVCYASFLVLPLALYRLLHHVSRPAAVLMVAFATVSVPISFVNLIGRLDVLTLLSGAEHLKAFSAEQLQALVMLRVASMQNGLLVNELFWGLWLLPFGWLVFKSGFLPRVLGVFLMLGCFGYLIHAVASVFDPDYPATTLAGLISIPSALGEIGSCLWLLIVGVRRRPGASG